MNNVIDTALFVSAFIIDFSFFLYFMFVHVKLMLLIKRKKPERYKELYGFPRSLSQLWNSPQMYQRYLNSDIDNDEEDIKKYKRYNKMIIPIFFVVWLIMVIIMIAINYI